VITELEHPHILPIYDYGQDDGVPYIAMRYLGGGSMEQWIRRGLPPLRDLERPLRQIAQALDHAHRQGVIHRDLKPGNIMLDEHGNAYLSDFGIARVLGSNLTGSLIVGTPSYMSPEQANGLSIDGRSDIYSLGVVLFEMLTGREPYEAETPMALLLKHINEPMPSVREFRPDVPEPVAQVVHKATAKEPNQRYASATEMIAAFSAALSDAAEESPTKPPTVSSKAPATEPSAATAAMPSDPALSSPAPVVPTPMQDESSEIQQAPRRLGLMLGLIAVVALIGGAAALALLSSAAQTDPADLIPTPFRNAVVVEDAAYTMSIPGNWADSFADQSEGDQLVHIWQDGTDVFVTLSMIEADVTGEVAFNAAIDDYNLRHYVPQDLPLIDEATAEDGTVRRSYRLENSERFPPGQMDVFYMPRGPYLVVLETYTADSTGNLLVADLQRTLDSLRVRAASSS
jgi:serine/threonine protein kinase